MPASASPKMVQKQARDDRVSSRNYGVALVSRLQLPRAWRIALLMTVSVIFAISTWIAVRQKPAPVGIVRGPIWTGGFWRYPLEWNSIKRLSSIDSDLLCVFALDESNVWVGGKNGVLLHSTDSGQTWEQIPAPVRRGAPEPSRNVDAIAFISPLHGYILSGEVPSWQAGVANPDPNAPGFVPPTLYETQDGAKHWTYKTIELETQEPKALQDLLGGRYLAKIGGAWPLKGAYHSFQLGDSAWGVSDSGAIFHVKGTDGPWLPQTQGVAGERLGNRRPYQYPAPWYFAVLVLCVGMAAFALKPVPDSPDLLAPGIANLAVSDRPLERGDADVLDCGSTALALSGFIRNRSTLAPLTIAVTGEWGSGKSSIMNLLRQDLEAYGMRPIWFNAWHNQTEDNLFATLLQNLRLQGVPRWWNLDFFSFRLRLLMIRLRKSWAPTLLYACLVAAIGGIEIVHNYTTPHDIQHLQVFFTNLFSIQKFTLTVANFFKEPLVYFLAGLVTLAVTVFRKLKAFGINPANLLASSAPRASTSDLDKQTSVRQQFAVELGDVTKALGPRKMVIFIDDLDRCQPDNACAVLEAVNYIVSSGACFVVMGLARRPVEACVGLSFSKVAEEMTNPTAHPQKIEDPADLRSRFARQYLDKLINIEIPVPPADTRVGGMMSSSKNSKPPARAPRFALTGIGALAAGLLIYISFSVGEAIGTPVQKIEAPGANVPKMALPATPQKSGTAGHEPVATNPERPVPVENAVVPRLASPAPSVSRAATFSPFAFIVIATLVAIVWILLRRRKGLVVYDSPEFVRALDIWKEFILRTHTTPRSIKRFMNRVRCTAMRVHPAPGGDPIWIAFLRRLSRWRFPRWLFAGLLPEMPSTHNADETNLGESLLVALTAIYEASPRWLELNSAESNWLKPGGLPPNVGDPAIDGIDRTTLDEAIKMHATHFPQRWPPTHQQVSDFLRLMGALTIR